MNTQLLLSLAVFTLYEHRPSISQPVVHTTVKSQIQHI